MTASNNWLVAVNNPEGIFAIYGKDVPSLIGVELHEISLSRNAASVALRFDTLSYPESPPQKWKDAGFDRVQLTLEFGVAQELNIVNWTNFCKFDLAIKKEGNMVRLKSSNGPVQIELLAMVSQIKNISAYVLVK